MLSLSVNTNWVLWLVRRTCEKEHFEGVGLKIANIGRLEGREMLRESDGRMIGSLGGSEVIGVVGGVVMTSRTGVGTGASIEGCFD
jgi:hypothetical protein